MLPLLLPIIGQLVPALIGHLFGSNAQAGATHVTNVAQTIFGTTVPYAIALAIAADPNKALEFKMRLIDIQDAENQRLHEERMAEFADLASARGAFAGNPRVFWLGIVILMTFAASISAAAYGCFVLMTEGIKIKDPGTVAVVFSMFGTLLGYVATNAQQVISYFFGSSASSDKKTDALSAQAMKTTDALGKRLAAAH